MFPVKGLNISVEKLKNETGIPTPAAASASKPARKRKRPGQESVTATNLADLWEKVIEHKDQPKQGNKRQRKDHEVPAAKNNAPEPVPAEQQKEPSERSEARRRKKKEKKEKRNSLAENTAEDPGAGEDEWNGIDDEESRDSPKPAKPAREKGDKKQRRQKGAGSKEDAPHKHSSSDKKATAEAAVPPTPAAPSQPKLTPLQVSMREKLISARFRHLNETLYTRPSAEAFQLFQDSPEMFAEYHEGFRRQVEVWPENPVDGYIADIKARAKLRFPPRNSANQPVTASQLPLPKPQSSKTCTIADLGCGDAKLAAALQPLGRKLHLDIRSFDLQTGGSALVTRADIANLPLPDASVDVAIFCLALMGTNWLSFVEEAYRVLRWRGELWVAEIKSRFAGPDARRGKAVVAHSVGNRRRDGHPPGKKSAKALAAREEEEAADLAELAELVDEVPRGGGNTNKEQQETDIGAFIEALRKRGFLLHRDLGEGAVDMSNKMFVRMHFVKAAPAVKGKCAGAAAAAEQRERKWTDGKGKPVAGPQQKKRFIDSGDGDDEDENEAAVLKPCVYKIR